jgi:hypothetical protein
MSYNSVDAAVEGCIDSYLDNYDFSSIIDSVKEAILEDDTVPDKEELENIQDLTQECESRIDKLEAKLERSLSILEKMILHPSFSLNVQLKTSILEEIKAIIED